jgi:hypothetical protein
MVKERSTNYYALKSSTLPNDYYPDIKIMHALDDFLSDGRLRLERAVLHHLLGDDDRVQRRTPQQLIAHDEELERVVEGDVLPQPTHLDVVLAGGRKGHGIFEIRDVVDELDTRCLLEGLASEGDVDGFVEDGDDALGVCARRGDAYRRATVVGFFFRLYPPPPIREERHFDSR